MSRTLNLELIPMSRPTDLPVSPKSRPNVLQGLPAEDISRIGSLPQVQGLFHKVIRNFQDYGWRITTEKALAYLVRAIYFRQVYRIYRIELEEFRPPATIERSGFTFRILTPQNGDMIGQIEEIAEWMRGRLKEELVAGQICLVALDGDQVAGFNLINLKQATLVLVNLQKKLRKGSAWSEHIAVKKEYRKSGLGSQLRYRIFDELQKRGIRRLYGGTLRSNIASLKLARSVGFKEISDIHYRKFLSLEKWRYRRVRG
jgi:GNAT superfamily N-acetyltransferase